MLNKVLIVAYSRYSSDARIKSYVAALKKNNIPYEIWMLKEEYYEKGLIKIMNKYQGNSNLLYLLSYLKFFLIVFIKSLINLKTFSVIHYNNIPNFIIFAFIINKLLGAKLILDFHDDLTLTYVTKYNTSMKSIIVGLLEFERYLSARFADFILTAVHKFEEEFINKGFDKNQISTILNVPHKDIFPIVKRSKTEKFNISFHGTITKRLGIEIIFDALEYLIPKIPILKLNLIGDGDYLEEIKLIADKKKLSGFIWFSNEFINVEDLPIVLSIMDVGVLPYRKNIYSDKYSLPVKIIENLAMGLPTIAPSFENIKMYFTDDMLLYYEPDNSQDLADKIYYAYKNPILVDEQVNNSKTFFQEYSPEKQEAKYLKILNELAKDE